MTVPRSKAVALSEEKETVQFYNFQWDPVADRKDAAFLIRIERDGNGRILRRTHESFKGISTRSTDPKTGSHGH